MSDPQPRRVTGHLRRHGIAYAALTVAFSFSPVPSMAADLVTTGDIANGAVTRPKLAEDSVVGGKILNESVSGADIKNGTITDADLGTSAKGAKVIRYDLGPRDFSTSNSTMSFRLPGSWDLAAVKGSEWSVSFAFFAPPTWQEVGTYNPSDASVAVYHDGSGFVSLPRTYAATNVYVFRTVATSTQVVAP